MKKYVVPGMAVLAMAIAVFALFKPTPVPDTTVSAKTTYTPTYSFTAGTSAVGAHILSELQKISTLLNGNIDSANISDGTIVAADISSDAITAAKISSGAVTTDKIQDNAVHTITVNHRTTDINAVAEGSEQALELNETNDQTISIVLATGETLSVDVTARLGQNNTLDDSDRLILYLYRDPLGTPAKVGYLLLIPGTAANNGLINEHTLSGRFYDNPGEGTHVYAIRSYANSPSGTWDINDLLTTWTINKGK